MWVDWWDKEYQPYLRRFMTKEDWKNRAKNLSLLAGAFDTLLNK